MKWVIVLCHKQTVQKAGTFTCPCASQLAGTSARFLFHISRFYALIRKCDTLVLLFFFQTICGKRKRKEGMQHAWALQPADKPAGRISICLWSDKSDSPSLPIRRRRRRRHLSEVTGNSRWPRRWICSSMQAPACLTGGIITDSPAIFNGQLVGVFAWETSHRTHTHTQTGGHAHFQYSYCYHLYY